MGGNFMPSVDMADILGLVLAAADLHAVPDKGGFLPKQSRIEVERTF